MCIRDRTESGYSSSWWSPCCRSSWRNARHLPHGRSRAGDRHLNFYETRDNLPLSPADDATAQLNHIVDLQSLDEDRLGEQLSVIWELEVGQTVTPAQGLPDVIHTESFDDPTTLAGFVDAMRWGAITSADPNRNQACLLYTSPSPRD